LSGWSLGLSGWSLGLSDWSLGLGGWGLGLFLGSLDLSCSLSGDFGWFNLLLDSLGGSLSFLLLRFLSFSGFLSQLFLQVKLL